MVLKAGTFGYLYNQSIDFYPFIDTEEDYKNNLVSCPIDWEYRNKSITYKFNNYGHRCVDLNELEDDYILFGGCSYTLGAGLALDDTYPYIVSNHFQKTYYNTAVVGFSPGMVARNLIGFLTSTQKKPSLIAIQWPCFHRYYRITHNVPISLTIGNDDEDEFFKNLMLDDDTFKYNIHDRTYLLHILKNLGHENILEVFIEDQSTIQSILDLGDQFTTKVDRFPDIIDHARDLQHPGTKTNLSYANLIINHIKNF